MNDVAVLIPSCDQFSDVHPVALACLRKYWPDCPWPIYTQSNRLPWGKSPILCGDDKGWIQNTLTTLDFMPELEFVCHFLDDMLLCRDVYTDELLEYLKIMRAFKEIGAFRVGQTGGDKPIDPSQDCEPFKALRIDPASQYYVSTGPTIWRVAFLRKVLEHVNGSTAWDFEIGGTAYARTCEEEIWMPTGPEHERPFRTFYTAITRGRWNRGCLNWLKEIGIEEPDLSRSVIEDNDRRPM
jgi:hypothetical protein